MRRRGGDGANLKVGTVMAAFQLSFPRRDVCSKLLEPLFFKRSQTFSFYVISPNFQRLSTNAQLQRNFCGLDLAYGLDVPCMGLHRLVFRLFCLW